MSKKRQPNCRKIYSLKWYLRIQKLPELLIMKGNLWKPVTKLNGIIRLLYILQIDIGLWFIARCFGRWRRGKPPPSIFVMEFSVLCWNSWISNMNLHFGGRLAASDSFRLLWNRSNTFDYRGKPFRTLSYRFQNSIRTQNSNIRPDIISL